MKSTVDKKELIDWIDDLDNQALLVTLQSMKNKSTGGDFWHDRPEETKQVINQAKKESEEGKGIPHEQVMREIDQQFPH